MGTSLPTQRPYRYFIGSKINSPIFNITNMFKFDVSKNVGVEINTQNSKSIGAIL
jgi:hypothetical protein